MKKKKKERGISLAAELMVNIIVLPLSTLTELVLRRKKQIHYIIILRSFSMQRSLTLPSLSVNN